MPNEFPLSDAAARAAIVGDVDVNMVVEAAAGTGKTTSLVGRLLTLFKRGALLGEARLAAVTFTHKAASELRERLGRELESALADASALAPEERAGLEAAAAALPECHIGTIHSFCGRLLRERPVEAGVGIDFRELDDADDQLLRLRAWEEFAAAMVAGEHAGLRRIFETFDLDRDTLGKGFAVFAEYPDVDLWPGDSRGAGQVDLTAFAEGVERFYEGLGRFKPALEEAECGNDGIIRLMQILDRRWPRLAKPLELADAFRLSALFRNPIGLVQGQWAQFGLDKTRAKEERDAYMRFHAGTVAPFRRDCLATVYAAALAAFRIARGVYDRLRRERRALNFQDLLMITARLLRGYPEVRADLAARYPRLLVDEVQDTDPVQAEIMFLLASEDQAEKDWRRCRPRPGSLFIVGDPKQSIYRFRRADIVVYQEVKRLVAEAGGRVLGLAANFRSQPSVIDWVNRSFGPSPAGEGGAEAVAAGRFTGADSVYGPAYIALEPGRPAGDGFTGVYGLETLPVSRKDGVGNREVIRDEAARIAACIRRAVDDGLSLPGPEGPRPAGPGDFMVMTYRTASASVYADALRRLGLPCQVSSGPTLADSPALRPLLGYLRALACPDDPVLLAAVLRGDLFGIDDARLYRWRKAGGRFDTLSPQPASDPDLAAVFASIAGHFRLFRTAEPVLALERVAGDLGLWPYSCLGDDAAAGAGALAAMLDLLAAERGSITGVGKLAERFAWLLDNHKDDPPPIAPIGGDAVRVMNLHKTKGLEAPVVFLTCTRTVKSHRPEFAVRRSGAATLGALSLAGGEHRERLLAQPAEWEEMAAEEELFLAAERTRLNYVAATRAGTALIVSLHKSGKTWQSAFLPGGAAALERLPEPAPPPRVPDDEVLATLDLGAMAAMEESRRQRLKAALRESYRIRRAKPEADWGVAAAPDGDDSTGAELGEVLHRLLAANLPPAKLRDMAGDLLRDYQLPAEHAGALVDMVAAARKSPIWKRAAGAERMFREAPYAVRLDDDGVGTLQRGVIDLVFREGNGWVVVDYKSDAVKRGGAEAAAVLHREQLAAYARAWRAITGESVVETGIYFLRSGEYVRVDVAEP